jgi:hypothetical protein
VGRGCGEWMELAQDRNRWANLRERDHWGDQDVDGRIILDGSSGSGTGLWGLDGVGSG